MTHSKHRRKGNLARKSGKELRCVKFPRGTMFLTNSDDHVLYLVTPSGFVFAVDVPIR